MRIWKVILTVALCALFSGQALAQSGQEKQREMESREVEYAERLRQAEERMEQAARQVAEITMEGLPNVRQIERRFAFSNRPRLGITIGGSNDSGPVDGVEIDGVTPGSAADDAGLRAGDIVTAVNDEPLNAGSSQVATDLLMEFMEGVVEGDQIKVDYERNGNAGSVEVSPRVMDMHAFAWKSGKQPMVVPDAPHIIKRFQIDSGFPWIGSSWGSMELVELNEGLGRYFGTESGLLVVSAPKSDDFNLQDGDVIQSIDGRTPSDVRHAMRILGSYKSGENLELTIMRDKKQQTIDVEIPDNHRGNLFAPAPEPVKPVRAPDSPKEPVPDVAT